jgi:hypothetical protein
MPLLELEKDAWRREMDRQKTELARNLHWHGASRQEIAEALAMDREEVEAVLTEAYGLPAPTDPTPDQLMERAAKIRSEWTDEDRRVRRFVATAAVKHGSYRASRRQENSRLASARSYGGTCAQSLESIHDFAAP